MTETFAVVIAILAAVLSCLVALLAAYSYGKPRFKRCLVFAFMLAAATIGVYVWIANLYPDSYTSAPSKTGAMSDGWLYVLSVIHTFTFMGTFFVPRPMRKRMYEW